MPTIEFDPGSLTRMEVTEARFACKAIEASAERNGEPGGLAIARSLVATIDAETMRRMTHSAFTGRLTIDDLSDREPDAARHGRQWAVNALVALRDRTDLLPSVRVLLNAAACALAETDDRRRALEWQAAKWEAAEAGRS